MTVAVEKPAFIEGVDVEYDNGVIYNVHNPEKVEWAPRNAFMQHVIETMGTVQAVTPIEDAILDYYSQGARGNMHVIERNTFRLAQDYIKYRNMKARLPKFSKWASGMFKDDKTLAKDLNFSGKLVDTSNPMTFTDDKMTMLRCAASRHLYSCLGPNGGWNDALPAILGRPGIALVYIDDPNHKEMRGRCWLNTAKVKATGEDCIVVCNNGMGTLRSHQVVQALQKKGFKAFSAVRDGISKEYGYGTEVKFVDCFDKAIHYDLYTWIPNFLAE